MFTKEQIKEVSSKVRTGADYPQLVQNLKALGIVSYEHLVSTGLNVYYGKNNHSVSMEQEQPFIEVTNESSADKLKNALKIHQQGETTYPVFCIHAGEAGVHKWVSDLTQMTVTYLDKSGNALVVESIPMIN